MKNIFNWIIIVSGIIFLNSCSSDSLSPDSPITSEEPVTTNLENHLYEIPVVFHVLYNTENQNVQQDRISDILTKTNQYFDGSLGGEDINVKFVLADKAPDGSTLVEKGVIRKFVAEKSINAKELMENDTYKDVIWDPNEYINVLLYNFEDKNSLGVSHLPYMDSNNPNVIDGITAVPHSELTLSNLSFTYCVSINSLYTDEESTDKSYTPLDINVTLAHELSHYLGLHHVFSEDENGAISDSYDDTDYCEDTPTYNKVQYNKEIEAIFLSPRYIFEDLILRKNKDGSTFISDNIMDYAYSLSNVLTKNQKSRIRAVLENGLMIPGPKNVTKSTNSTRSDELLDLPIKTTSCPTFSGVVHN